MSNMTNTKGYREVFDYLVNNASKNEPATLANIVDGSGVGRTTAYRLLTPRIGSVDETISDGILIAPETFSVNGGRPAKTYYADPSRIVSAEKIAALTLDKVPLPGLIDAYEIRPIRVTPSYLDQVNARREVINSFGDSLKSMAELLQTICVGQSEQYAMMPKYYAHLGEQYSKAVEHYRAVTNGEVVLDTKLMEEFHHALKETAKLLTAQVELLQAVMHIPEFDNKTFKVFDPAVGKPEVAGPAIRKRD